MKNPKLAKMLPPAREVGCLSVSMTTLTSSRHSRLQFRAQAGTPSARASNQRKGSAAVLLAAYVLSGSTLELAEQDPSSIEFTMGKEIKHPKGNKILDVPVHVCLPLNSVNLA